MSLFSLENEAKINGSQVTLVRLNKLIDLDLKVRNAFVWTEQFIFRIEWFLQSDFIQILSSLNKWLIDFSIHLELRI